MTKKEKRVKKKETPGEMFRSFAVAILIALVFRSVAYEPFHIPSGSMLSTLYEGDYIFVSKLSYGYSRYSFPFSLPLFEGRIFASEPKRGDVVVFRLPSNPKIDYIKRVIGVPGDKVAYQNKRLTINGQPVETTRIADYLHPERLYYSQQFVEKAGGVEHRILNDADAPGFISDAAQFEYRNNCLYNNAGVICTVPPGHYFMMGDNRDNSRDSRFWGFVPEQNIVGKAFLVGFNFSDLKRIGSFR